MHDDDDRPSVTVIVEHPKKSLTPPPMASLGKAAAGVAALSALAELIHQMINLLGGQ